MKNKIDPKEKKNKEKKQKKKKSAFRIILLILLLVIIIFGGWFIYKVNKNGGGLKGITSTVIGSDTQKTQNLPKLQCVVMGESLNLTDTIMICSYDPKTQEASIMSIPRDTFIGKNKNRATAFDKINSLYQKGPEKTVQAINDITGLNIKYYITIDTKALRELVDEIGGVEYNVPINMDYDDPGQDLYIHLKAGIQKLDGNKAEQLLRFRHNNNGTSYPEEYGDNDIGRMRTQREFISVLAKQVLKPENIFKITKFVDIAKNNVETNLDFESLKDYIPYSVEFNSENIKTATLPGAPEKCNGVWLYTHDKTETKNIVQSLFSDEEEKEDEEQETNTIASNNTTKNNVVSSKSTKDLSKIDIEILNGSGSKANLDKAKKDLANKGFNIKKTGTTSETAKSTIINRTTQSTSIEEIIEEVLDIKNTKSGSNNAGVDITIILGKDY